MRSSVDMGSSPNLGLFLVPYKDMELSSHLF